MRVRYRPATWTQASSCEITCALLAVLQWLRRSFIVCLMLALWPIALLVIGIRSLWPSEAAQAPLLWQVLVLIADC